MHTFPRALGSVVVAALLTSGLVACGQEDEGSASGGETTADSPEATEPTQETTTDDSGASGTAGTGALEAFLSAIAAAEAEAGGTAYEADRDDGGWDIDVAVGGRSVEVRIGSGGGVVGTDEDDALDDDDRRSLAAATITIGEAAQAAVDEVPGEVTDVDLDRENGTHLWEVQVTDGGTETDVAVDVTDGTVVGTNRDD